MIGQTDAVTLRLNTDTEKPVCLPPHRIPDKLLQLGLGIPWICALPDCLKSLGDT